jgi:heptosyltransferase-2
VNKVLIIGPAWVGDMVMAQSLFKILKSRDPSGVIDVLAPDWTRPLLNRMPEVRASHTMPILHGVLALKERYRLAEHLKPMGYTQAIVLPNSWKSALIPWWAKIPKRTGFLGECRFGLLNDFRFLDKNALPRMIDRFVALAFHKQTSVVDIKKNIPYPHLEINPVSLQTTIQKFSVQDYSNQRILALCPGAEFGASKRWPESHYAAVAIQKLKEGWSVWLFGSKNDQAVAARIQQETNHRCLDFTGKTDLGEAIELLSLTHQTVTNDSGLMHIAAALQKPVVAVYGSTDPGFTPPLGDTAQIVRLSLPCSPCFKRECPLGHHQCMQGLLPEQVLIALDTVGQVR